MKNEIAALNFRTYLRNDFLARKNKNSKFSLRGYARMLGTDASTLKRLMDGKRPLGSRTIKNFGSRLGLSNEKINLYIEVHSRRRRLNVSLEDEEYQAKYQILGPEHSELLSNPYSYGVLEWLKISGGKLSDEEISTVFDLELATASQLISKMKKLKWIKQGDDGNWESSLGNTTTDPLDDKMIQVRNQLMVDILRRSLNAYQNVPRENRAHAAFTIAIDRSILPDVIAKMRILARDIEAMIIEKSPKPNEIYQFQIGLFPLSKS